MSRIEHENWECPVCRGRGWDPECGGLGTREDYYRVQQLHEFAIRNEEGVAARTLQVIEFFPYDLKDRRYWVDRMIRGALRQEMIHGV